MWIYKVTNVLNGKCYVGKTKSLRRRWAQHRSLKDRTSGIVKAMLKHGVENFTFEVLQDGIETHQELSRLEIEWIERLKSFGPGGYNMTLGGDGAVSRAACAYALGKKSDATRAKMSETAKNRSEAYRLRMSEALSGKPKSAAHREQLRQNACSRPTARVLEFDGRSLNVATWARLIGMSKEGLKSRLDKGMSVEDALTKPVGRWA